MRSEASAAKGCTCIINYTHIIMTILKGMIWTCHGNFRDFLSMHNYVLACVRVHVCCVYGRVCNCVLVAVYSASVLCMSSPTQ